MFTLLSVATKNLWKVFEKNKKTILMDSFINYNLLLVTELVI